MMKIFDAVSADRSPRAYQYRDLYIFIPESCGFASYTTDSSGRDWSRVTRWVLEGLPETGYSGGALSVRPLSMKEICRMEKKTELRRIFSNILYKRVTGGARYEAVLELFDRGSGGLLALTLGIPAGSILRNAYLLRRGSAGVALMPLNRGLIAEITENLR